MTEEMHKAIAEEVREVESLAELKAMWCFGQRERNEYAGAECVDLFKQAVRWLVKKPKPKAEVVEELVEVPKMPVVRAPRAGAKYKLMSFDVSWSSKPQVHAVAAILEANAKVGDVLHESHIVEMMVANEEVLQTRQGGKRIWDYYKGNHVEGLLMHGNVEKV